MAGVIMSITQSMRGLTGRPRSKKHNPYVVEWRRIGKALKPAMDSSPPLNLSWTFADRWPNEELALKHAEEIAGCSDMMDVRVRNDRASK